MADKICGLLERLIPFADKLNRYYVDHITNNESRTMINAYSVIHRGDLSTPCYITASALAWVLSNVDIAPPFTDIWDNAQSGIGENIRLVAGWEYTPEDGEDFEHICLVVGNVVFDSLWKYKKLSLHKMTENEWDEYEVIRHIPIKMCDDLEDRINKLILESFSSC